MYDTSTYPHDIRRTNPDCLRASARSLERCADQLPQSVAGGQGEAISNAIDAALVQIAWELNCLADDLLTSFNGQGSDRAMHATAIRKCAAPLGLALHCLAKAMDHISSHHRSFVPPTDAQIKAPKDLLLLLKQDIDQARAAIYATANQFKINASLLGSSPIADTPTPN
ncbi:hypothetical protein F9278_15445 [Streptomyces phaeolivaceus]|uniref:Uncharacterized protein n=1 Tax=Streptomyces phaeolivaceus TaxID=2653200 RepID=A0A5P8K4C0_9ACTN|nr:hypothetical protein [Streptomyces phaeolivaceus]QFQ97369.1 hypothetical protein F9278_15445 [Streptomyces phaeolivaceus]